MTSSSKSDTYTYYIIIGYYKNKDSELIRARQIITLVIPSEHFAFSLYKKGISHLAYLCTSNTVFKNRECTQTSEIHAFDYIIATTTFSFPSPDFIFAAVSSSVQNLGIQANISTHSIGLIVGNDAHYNLLYSQTHLRGLLRSSAV